MIRTTFRNADKDAIPAGVEFFSLLLLLYGILEFAACFLPPRNIFLLGYMALAILLISTAALVLFNHRWARNFVLLVTIATTVGIVRDFWHQNFGFSGQTIWLTLRMVLLTGILCAYLWYRNWRRTLNAN
jgi:hypothetical protein